METYKLFENRVKIEQSPIFRTLVAFQLKINLAKKFVNCFGIKP